jgi:hypothetical protein
MTHRLMLLLLVGGSVLFGAIILLELQAAGVNDPVIAEVAARPERAATVHGRQGPRVEELVATALARPLFSSTRRPPQTAVAGTGDSDLADRRLTGIVTTPGRRLAIFAVSGDKPLKVAEGDEVSGWRVESITPREVSLTGPSGSKTLQPKLDPNLTPPPSPLPINNAAGRPPTLPAPGVPRPPVPPAAAAGPVNPAVPGTLPRPLRPRQR